MLLVFYLNISKQGKAVGTINDKKKGKLPLCADDMIMYLTDLKESMEIKIDK